MMAIAKQQVGATTSSTDHSAHCDCQVWDGSQVVASGVLRGCGRQLLAAVVGIAGFYLIGISVAVYLGFKLEMGVFGQWIGIASAGFVVFGILLAVILLMDWSEQAKQAQQVARNDNNAASSRAIDEQVLRSETAIDSKVIEVELQEVVVAVDTSTSVQ
jgi:hypothetical protein